MKQKLYPIKLYIRHVPNLTMIGLSLLLNIASWVWLVWNIGKQDQQIFLHYNVLFGVDLIGNWNKMFNLPISGLFILILNATIGWLFFRNDKFISHIFNAIGLITQIIIFIASSLLVFLNV